MPAERPCAMRPAPEAGEAVSQLTLLASRNALAHSSNYPSVNKVGAPQLGSDSLSGVSWLEDQGLWQAALYHEGSTIDRGTFETPDEAACAYDAAALVIGADHPLNFPSQEARVSSTTKQKCLSLAESLGKSSAVARSLSLYEAAQGNKEQRGPAEEGRQQKGAKNATDCLARPMEPGSLVQGFSLQEKEAVSALKASQQ
ncbi:hypothetical protein WJX77_008202 [Trebouxia sp. C0004]